MFGGSGLIISSDTSQRSLTSTSRSKISELAPIKGDEVSIEPPSKQLQLAVNPNPNIDFNSSAKTPDLELPTLAGLSKQIKDLLSDVKILISNNKHIRQKEGNHQV